MKGCFIYMKKSCLYVVLILCFIMNTVNVFSEDIPLRDRVIFEDTAMNAAVMKAMDFDGILTKEKALTVTELKIKGDIKSLKGLEYFRNLKTFIMESESEDIFTGLETLIPITTLKNLINLGIVNYTLKDIMVLGEMIWLKNIRIQDSNLTSFPPIKDFNDIIKLDLSNNSIKDISFMSGNQNISRLILYDNDIEDLSPLNEILTIKYLDLSNNNISSIKPLETVLGIRELYLRGGGKHKASVSSLEPLLTHIDLEVIDMPYHNIKEIKPLFNNKNLIKLNLKYSLIDDPDSLQSFPSLEEAKFDVLSVEALTDISKIPGLKDFKILNDSIDSKNLADISTYRDYLYQMDTFFKDNFDEETSSVEKVMLIYDYIIDKSDFLTADWEKYYKEPVNKKDEKEETTEKTDAEETTVAETEETSKTESAEEDTVKEDEVKADRKDLPGILINDENKDIISNPDSVLLKGFGDNIAYTLTLRHMLKRAGFDSKLIYGSYYGDPHFWILVDLLGNNYHLDPYIEDIMSAPEKDKYLLKADYNMVYSHIWNNKSYEETPELSYEESKNEERKSPVVKTLLQLYPVYLGIIVVFPLIFIITKLKKRKKKKK
jgi:hypothetical protein